MTSGNEVLREARKQKRADEVAAYAMVVRAIKDGVIDHKDLHKAGKFLSAGVSENKIGGEIYDVLLVGQCTTDWLKDALVAHAAAIGYVLRITLGNYDTVMQDVSAFASTSGKFDVVVTHAWSARITNTGLQDAQLRIQEEVDYWRGVWSLVTEKIQAKLIHVGYDWLQVGERGFHLSSAVGGAIRLVDDANRASREAMPVGGFFIDPTLVSAVHGKSTIYDMRSYYWTKNPYTDVGSSEIARHICSGLQAITTGPKKLLVLDLDNTLWGGVVGEIGPEKVALSDNAHGEAFKAFQQYCKKLSERGVLLAVATKNNEDDAKAPFMLRDDCVLRLDDFSAFEAHWNAKSVSLERIASTLSLGLDSFVFFDDNPVERDAIRSMLPQVSVVDVPEDPCCYIAALEGGLYFESVFATAEDRARAKLYRAQSERKAVQARAASVEDFLQSLEMTGIVEVTRSADIARVTQLIGKTNQFNMTTRRHSAAALEMFLNDSRSLVLNLKLHDKYGDSGLVGVMIGAPHEARDTIVIDTFLLSCRVLGRSAEHFFMAEFIRMSLAKGYQRVVADYVPTGKNVFIADIYADLGFELCHTNNEGVKQFELRMSHSKVPTSYIKRIGR